MTIVELWMFIITGLFGIAMYLVKSKHQETEMFKLKVQDALNHIQINYVHKQDLKEFKQEFSVRFDRLEQKLDSLIGEERELRHREWKDKHGS
jgi:hypothetical protein